jgi:hypothetical protein
MKSLTRLVEMALCALLLTALVPAYSASFGRTTVGVTPSGGLRADFKRGSKFVLPERGAFQQICAYLDSKGSTNGTQALILSLYRDRNGVPAEQVVETASLDFPAGRVPADWYCFYAAEVPLDAGVYWAVIHSGGDPGIVRYFYDGPSNWYGNADSYADGSAPQFGNGGTGEGTMSIYINYFPESQLHSAGRQTVGSQVSSPMSSSFKRGSSFVVSEAGSLHSLSVYVDGLGGASGEQKITLALYDDVNNQPSALVTQQPAKFESPIAGRSGRWVTALSQFEDIPLVPGRYWLMLHTTGPAGVMRYYLDGTAGNWRGNANPGTSASGLFGTGNPGDGTASAYILYRPTNVAQHDFGQATPGMIPSKGLSADFIRGSSTSNVWAIGGPLYMSALWAYLDGRGGATGSQKVRLTVYDQSVTPMSFVMQSAEVTIASGTPPGWVRFAVPYTKVYWGNKYAIMIMSSGTAGVVRNYATNEPNLWLGAPTPYASGPPNVLYQGANAPGQPVLQTGAGRVSVFGNYQVVYTQ